MKTRSVSILEEEERGRDEGEEGESLKREEMRLLKKRGRRVKDEERERERERERGRTEEGTEERRDEVEIKEFKV